jgi:hypothetical protein
MLISDDAETVGSSSSTANDTSSSHEEAEIMRSTLIVNDTDSSHGESEIRGKFFFYVFSFEKISYIYIYIYYLSPFN